MTFHPPHVVDIVARETVRSLASIQPRNVHLKATIQRDPNVFPLPYGPVRYDVVMTRWRGARRFRVHTTVATVPPEVAVVFHCLAYYLFGAAFHAPAVKPPKEDCYGAPPAF
jgi:hypothetical protein